MNVQATTANKVHEITGVTNSVGTAWATPTYDGAGNMIGMPNPPATITGTMPAWVPMTEARHYYYTPGWQCVEERLGTTAERQFVWGLRYIDDLVLRDIA